MHQPSGNAGDQASTSSCVTSHVQSGYLQKNYHIDGNLYSVLTPSPQTDKSTRGPKTRGRRKTRWKLKFHHQALPPEYREHYEAATEAASLATPFMSSPAPSPAASRSGKDEHPASKSPKTPKPVPSATASCSRSSAPPSPPTPVDRTSELPYMGEITLDSKPRRGRKPKKADICHLIYKNYGTVFPSPKNNPPESPITTTENKPKISWTKNREEKKSSIFQNNLTWTKTSGSLLEKRLTGGLPSAATKLGEVASVSTETCENKNSMFRNGSCDKISKTQSNLRDFCLMKRRSAESAVSKALTDPPPPPPRDPGLAQACVKRLLVYAAGLDEQSEPLNLCMRDRVKLEPSSGSDSEPEELTKLPPGLSPIETTQPGGYVFWPSAGVFVHPQLLYKPPSPVVTPATISTSSTSRALKKKRKRSAIFIPPAESPTEVSICKFKFTGGAKPSLEEKKMLSVDAGGNFRFYSGTDKGMRSFLPHLQHSPVVPPTNSSPHVPLHKVNLSPSEESFPMQSSPSPASSIPLEHLLSPPSPQDRSNKRKRRSRKSEVREKLEQTFKEKGFLIQTQQLESAEGATYCKFRQLRKFTRYLFRSWRDYLPHSIQDLTQANQQQPQQECSMPSSAASIGDPALSNSSS